MAQHDYVIANGTGAAVRSDLNGGLAAIVSNNSGATQPATTYAYQWWADTTTGLLKVRNAANSAWVTVGTLASANLGLLPLAGGTMTGELLIGNAGTLVFEGSTNDGNETTLAVADPTTDRTITLPNQTGTVLVSGNASIVNADVNASAGITAGKLSFTQTGTGATARTVDSRLKDVVSVKDFGAVGDGTTNDTTAFAAAFANLNAGSAPKSLYIPSGNYLVNHSTCTITSSKRTLFGDGFASRIIIASVVNGAWGILADGTSASVHVTDVLIANLAVVASGWTGAGGENGISVNRADRCSVQRCQVMGNSAATSWEQGIIFRDSNNGLIANNHVQRITGNGISLDLALGSENTFGNLVVGNIVDFVGDSGIAFHNNVRYSSAIGNIVMSPGQVVGGTGLDLAGCQYCLFSGNKITNSAQFGIRLLQNLSYSTVDNVVSNNTVEHPSTATDAAIALADCNRNRVVNNLLICNTPAKHNKAISIFYTTNATQTHPITSEAIEKLSGSVIRNNTIHRFTNGIFLDAGGGITVANFIVDGNVLQDCTTGIGFTTASGEKRFTLYGHNYYFNCTNRVSSATGGIAVNFDPLYDTISCIPCNVSTAGIETTVTSALVTRIPSSNQILLGIHRVTEYGGWDGAINYKASSGSILVSDIFGTVTNAIRSSVIPLASSDLITITINKTNLSPGVSGVVECTGLSLALLTYY